MNTTQITETLRTLYAEHGNRIVFWNDPEGEFLETLTEMIPGDVELLRPDEVGSLVAKIRIEIESPEQRFLVYTPTAQPEPTDDWLLDIRLYSRTFSADSASMMLSELALTTQTLREYLAKRKSFLSSKDRVTRLKRWVLPDDTETDLDKKMLAVAIRAEQPETFAILLKIFGELTDELTRGAGILPGVSGLQNILPTAWREIEKFGLGDYFWRLAEETFGYGAEQPQLSDLLVRLFVSDLKNSVGENLPPKIGTLTLKNRSGFHNASVFLANWRSNVDYLDKYRLISKIIEEEIGVQDWIGEIGADLLADNETFELIEKRIVSNLRDSILLPLPTDLSELRLLINSRRDKFCARGAQNLYRSAYDAIAAALEFFVLRQTYQDGFSFPTATSLISAYTKELFRFDQFYRLFHESAGPIVKAGWDLLNGLIEAIENTYGGWYIDNLAMKWGKCLEHENLLKQWQIDGMKNQFRFYDEFVKPSAHGSTERKVYVVISDAFRYESAEELTRELNTEARKSGNAMHEAEMSAVLGVLPSYTALGMAALLPHETLDYKVNSSGLDVIADGRSSSGISNRVAILNKYGASAIKYDDLTKMSRDSGRAFVREYRVIYVYHNRIDATGDSASTEEDTFDAVRKTIDELIQLVTYLFNMSGSQVFITADHGFLFQQTAPENLDRSELQVASGAAKVRKKRYVIDSDISEQENAWHGQIRSTAQISGDMQFLIPKGANRFHFTGGSRFVHGGAMPQEVVVPVISIRKLQGKAAERSAIRKVGVTLLGNLTRIVNNVQKLEFIQTEVVSDRITPRTLQISLRDQAGKLISNEETVTFDSNSDSMGERRKVVQLILRTGAYDRTQNYYLVLNDTDAIVKEYLRLPIMIDIAISSDF